MAFESACGSITTVLAELMVEPVRRQFRYMFCFNDFVKEFKQQKENLISAKERLQDDVEVAERNAEEIYEDVKKWLRDAKNEIEGAEPLENEIGKNGKCFTWCPNCMRQFKLSKALAKKSETFRELLEKKFTKVSHRAHPQPIEFLLSKEFTRSKSSEEALQKIMDALKDDKVNMIGLRGMGGVGKTTLVKEVGRIAKELQLFPEVLMATMSQNPNVTGIQDRLADMLGLDIKEKSKEGRADRLRQRLKQVEKMLIILDDVWKHIDLKEIGIPFGDDHMGCKILLTTRREDICSSMKCQSKVFLGGLSVDEALALFRINAGIDDGDDGDSTLTTVAGEVARECHGLPIALVTVGRALRDKPLVQWELASKQLKNSQFPRMEQNDDHRNAYTCLKLSYDFLKLEETKSCFVLCCLFPEDYDIPIEDLTRYAVAYGLHQDAEPIEDARKRVSVAIDNLKDCSMLVGSETEEHVKMHDLVRDVAIQIASEEYGFKVKAGLGLEKWPWTDKRFEGCTTISLMGNKLAELPEGLECPQLKVLLLEVDDGLNVPERFFEGMKEIEVLSLEGGCLSLQSLELSTKLQSLVLECECKDLIWLRKLQRLKILVFQLCSSIEELPDEIGELKELRLLDVRDCDRLRRIPVNLIGRLKKLEELLIGPSSFDGWDVDGCDSTGGMNASLTELNSLSQLAVLSLRIPKVECIPRDFVFPDSLRKYDIILANANEYYIMLWNRYPTSLILVGTSLNAKTFEQLFLHKLEFVEVRDCGDVSTLFPARLRQGLKNLKEVIVDRCESLEEVFELGEGDEASIEEEELPLLSSLTELQVRRLPQLKCIWKGPTRHVSLHSLARLELNALDKLTFIFTPCLTRSLPQLERLEISACGELKHIIREEDGEREIIPESPCFPQLKHIIIQGCGKLEYVLPVSVSPSLLNLDEMRILNAHNLKQIFYSGEGDALPTDGIIKFPRLSELFISSRSNYSFFGPKNFAAQLPSLQILKINGHKELGNLSAQLQGLTNFETLCLNSLPDTRCIWKGALEQNGCLQRLKSVHVGGCGDVRAPFPAKLLRALNNLSTVGITSCKSLEEVFELDGADEGSSEEKELLSSLTELRLSCLPELKCICKGPTRHVSLHSLARLYLDCLDKLTFIITPSLARSLSKLESLRIRACGELKHIIREEDGEREIIPESPCFPQLKHIIIKGCGKLEYVFPVSVSLTLQSLPQLERLEISACGELKHIIREEDGEREIIPESPCFPQLKHIFIEGCGKLEYVLPVSVSPSLLNLDEMRILNAHNLKQIFYSGEGDALNTDGIIKFPRLSELDISSRSNYSFFGPKNFAAQLPSLQILKINGHKELGNLSAQLQQNGCLRRLKSLQVCGCGDVRAPFPAKLLPDLNNLRKVEIKDCKSLEEVFELGELPDEGSSEEKELLSSLTELQVRELPELKCIWKGPTRHVSLHSLARLNLDSLDKLTFIFTPSLAQSLSKLESLRISACGELKHIIREEDGEREIIPESPGQDDQASPINVEKNIVLPNLKKLSLEQLSSIVCFSSGWCDYFVFPRLEKLKVYQCPKLTTKFATTPDGSMSAQSEVPEVAEYSSNYRKWTRNNGWKEEEEEEEEEDDDDDDDDDW